MKQNTLNSKMIALALVALLSALSETPIRQSWAITGSVDQTGRAQVIGGVNEKIEGFFEVCSARGLTGSQGVLIPDANVPHLMLREDVVEAIEAGRFAVHQMCTLDDAIETVVGIDHVGDDPVAATAAAAAGARRGFEGDLDAEVEHPVGRIAARRFLGFRIMDQLGHTWDVATGIGRPAPLPGDAIRVALQVAAAEREMLDASTHFAMPPDVDVDSGDPRSTFLQMIGRDPGAAPS